MGVLNIKQNELMSRHTNFRIGGPAQWFVEVKNINELKEALAWAKKNQTPFFVFGGGSNLLVSDGGFDGVMIKIAMREISVDGGTIKAQAGALSSAVARTSAHAGLSGLTWMISLPGTIGGAVRGNAGCFGGETKEHLIEVEILRDDQIITVKQDDLKFGYRESAIKHSSDIILSATFKLEKGDVVLLQNELDQTLAARKSSQPLEASSAGCLFKNYEVKSDEELQHLDQMINIPESMKKNRRISAGWIIDQLGLKGTQIGGAKISEKHGNFVLNIGQATAHDVIQIINLIKTRAQKEFDINLEEEVVIIK